MHTLGTLLEDGQYKKAMAEGNLGALIGSFVNGLVDSGNPLEKGGDRRRGSYEVLNRDSGTRFFFSLRGSAAYTVLITSLEGV